MRRRPAIRNGGVLLCVTRSTLRGDMRTAGLHSGRRPREPNSARLGVAGRRLVDAVPHPVPEPGLLRPDWIRDDESARGRARLQETKRRACIEARAGW